MNNIINRLIDHSDKIVLQLEANDFNYTEDAVFEMSPVVKKAVRGGEVTTLTTCPKGYHLTSGGKCEKTSPQQAMAMSKRSIKAAKTRKSKGGNSVKIARAKSMKVRARMSPATFKEKRI